MTATDPDKDARLEYSLDFSGLNVELRGERVESPVSTQAARVRNNIIQSLYNTIFVDHRNNLCYK